MKLNRIRALPASDQPIVATRLMIGDPMVVELVGMTGAFDYFEFLAEYASYDLRGLEDICRAAELRSLGTMIKLDWEHRRFMAQRSVGAGFDAVLFADSRSAEDVRSCVHSLTPGTPEHGGGSAWVPTATRFPSTAGPGSTSRLSTPRWWR
jgi:2-keto-3-deoxy-L-rhamnonate aldolase RhmA